MIPGWRLQIFLAGLGFSGLKLRAPKRILELQFLAVLVIGLRWRIGLGASRAKEHRACLVQNLKRHHIHRVLRKLLHILDALELLH